MSGFEVAGLVLAIFPIVVRGLQQFTDGVQTIKSWKRYKRELSKYLRTLETQRIVYLNTIETLFEGIIQTNEELEELMEDPAKALSHKPQYEESLRNRLGRSYDNYLLIMKDLLEVLIKVQKELGLDEQGKHLWDNLPSLERQVKRLKLVLSRNIYIDLFTQIDKANKQLNHYTQETRILESARSKRRLPRQSVDFKIIRHHARSLYNVLVTGRSWKCRCRKDHMASLCLEPWPWEEETDAGKLVGAANLKFRVLLSKEQRDDKLGITWIWQGIEVEPVDNSGSLLGGANDESQTLSLTTLSIVQAAKPLPKKKGVSFATMSTVPPPKVMWPSTSTNCCNPGMCPITDLCTATQNVQDPRKEIGFLTDEGTGKERHDVYFVNETVRPEMAAKSLEFLLQASQQRTPGVSLSRRDRLYIAVTLASSVLQLDGTFWLKRRWRSGDIVFLPTEEDPSVAKPRIDYSHPYVSWRVLPNDTNTNLMSGVEDPASPRQIRNEFLFALGITLIELSLKRNLAKMRIPEDGLLSEVTANYNTAIRLIDDVYNESGTRYGDVVQRCLTCPLNLRDLRDFGLDNEELQEDVFDHILTPLRQDLEVFKGNQRFL